MPGLSARKGFYGPRLFRRPSPQAPGYSSGFSAFLAFGALLGLSWPGLGFFLGFFSAFWLLLLGESSARRQKEPSGVDFGSQFGLLFTHFWVFFGHPFTMRFQALFWTVFHEHSSLIFVPRANGRPVKNATPSMRKPVFSRCAHAPAAPARRRKTT